MVGPSAVVTYIFARTVAVVTLIVNQYSSLRNPGWVASSKALAERITDRHNLEESLDAYKKAAVTAGEPVGPPFRSAVGKAARLSARPVLRSEVWR